jgi:UDP-N-acetylmuramate--alanine ligase
MKLTDKKILSKEEMLEAIKTEKPSVLIMCGAGDIDALVNPVKEIMAHKK